MVFFTLLIFCLFLPTFSVPVTDRPGHVKKKHAQTICEHSDPKIVASTVYEVNDPSNKFWCCECLAGFYVAENCKQFFPNSTQCAPCPPSTFASEANHNTACEKSLFCDHLPYTIQVEGSSTKNNKCLCINGTFSPSPEIAGCKKHNQCPQGFGIKTFGNATHDGTCEFCAKGMCSNLESSTQRCQKCEEMLSNGTMNTPYVNQTDRDFSVTATSPAMSEAAEVDNRMYVSTAIALLIIAFLLGVGCTVLCSCLKKRTMKQGNKGKVINMNGLSRRHSVSQNDDSSLSVLPGEPSKDESRCPLLAQEKSSCPDEEKPESDHIDGALKKEKPQKQDEPTTESELKVREKPGTANEALPHRTDDPDPKSLTENLQEDVYRKAFWDLGFIIAHDPDKDGNCQFSAIASFLFPELLRDDVQAKAKVIRCEIVEFIKSHSSDFEGFDELKLDTYLIEMSKNKYGDHITLYAAHRLYNVQFLVIQTTGQRFSVPQGSQQGQPLLLGHIDEDQGKHYVCLKPKPSVEDIQANHPADDERLEQHGTVESPSPSSLDCTTIPPNESTCVVEQLHDMVQEDGEVKPGNGHVPSIAVEQTLCDLALFSHKEERDSLSQVDPKVLHRELESEDCRSKMLSCLCQNMTSSELRNFIRQNRLLKENRIIDVEVERRNDQSEMRVQLLRGVVQQEGRSLTPRKLLEISSKYEDKAVYGLLCESFVEHIKDGLNS